MGLVELVPAVNGSMSVVSSRFFLLFFYLQQCLRTSVEIGNCRSFASKSLHILLGSGNVESLYFYERNVFDEALTCDRFIGEQDKGAGPLLFFISSQSIG